MSDKSPRHGKSPKSTKSIKEKRAEKRDKPSSTIADPIVKPTDRRR
ncbi:hypothetical protein BKA08_003024 [Nocardioides marinisabuli]|uniref:Uncharacterized protein n=1 Tax=Nocardioides marinisabuli TaxID=419476 RepID=A0A7Y9F3N2_9ACTN|nr:hypothetical protein [Nocardioides marinisabuli]NYD58786.1 hypothetical protein [Nocardioides marinisabuli]